MNEGNSNVGRLPARPALPKNVAPTGLQSLGVATQRDALLYVPTTYQLDKPMPLLIMLHGASGTAQSGLNILQSLAEKDNFILLAPASRRQTWDIIMLNEYGIDINFINQALTVTFENYNIDAKHIAIGGFSDGASYALSMGLINGDLFTHVVAFSPGFANSPSYTGNPLIFVSHGTQDNVLPIQYCSRKIVPRLQQMNYAVTYHEFNGSHAIPTALKQEAVNWFLKP